MNAPVAVPPVGTDWGNIKTPIKHEGKAIILPGDPVEMEYDDAIEALKREKEQQSQEFDVHEVVVGAPWDALVAIYMACQEIYGNVTSHSIKTWFGDIKPQFVTIQTGPLPHEKIQVPKGQMMVPAMKSPFFVDFAGTQGAVIYGTVKRKDQSALINIANKARQIIREKSVYKGKAIHLSVTDDNELNMGVQPDFLDLRYVTEADMVHTRDTEAMIQTSVFSPLKNTQACRDLKIPLKRGILLEGKYGTGKSLTARVTGKVAIDNGWTFIMLDRAKGLKAAIEFARSYQPCVIFAEDLDRTADRSDENVNDLVNLIDGVHTKDMELMVILTTNFVENIDQSLLRPGRLDAVISIEPPDADAVVRLIQKYAFGRLREGEDLTAVGGLIAGQIPAVIREMVERSKLAMLSSGKTELSAEDLRIAAVQMARQMKLLEPKDVVETPAEKLFAGIQAAVAGAFTGDVEIGDSSERFDELTGKLVQATKAIRQDIGGATKAAMGASGEAGQARATAEKVLAKVSSR